MGGRLAGLGAAARVALGLGLGVGGLWVGATAAQAEAPAPETSLLGESASPVAGSLAGTGGTAEAGLAAQGSQPEGSGDAADPGAVRGALETVSQPVASTLDTATGTEGPVESGLESVAETAEPVVETVEPVADPVVETVEPALESVAETAEPALESVAETARPAVDAVEGATAPVVDAVAPAVESAVEAVKPATGAVGGVLESAKAPALEAVLPQDEAPEPVETLPEDPSQDEAPAGAPNAPAAAVGAEDVPAAEPEPTGAGSDEPPAPTHDAAPPVLEVLPELLPAVPAPGLDDDRSLWDQLVDVFSGAAGHDAAAPPSSAHQPDGTPLGATGGTAAGAAGGAGPPAADCPCGPTPLEFAAALVRAAGNAVLPDGPAFDPGSTPD